MPDLMQPDAPPQFLISRNDAGTVMLSAASSAPISSPVEARFEGTDLLIRAGGIDRIRFCGIGAEHMASIRDASILLLSLVWEDQSVAWRISLARDATLH